MDKAKRTKLLLVLCTLLLLAALALFLWRTGFFSSLGSEAELEAYIWRFTPHTHLIYFLIQLAAVILAPIPSNLLAAAGGILFGTLCSFLLTFSAVLLGSMLVFLLARFLGRSFADRLVSQHLSDRYLDLIRQKQTVFLILVFLFPFFPDDLICILAGLTDIKPLRFFLLCLFTRPWGLLFASALGGASLSLPPWLLVLLGLILALLFLLGLKYGDKLEAAILRKFKNH